MTPQRKAVGVKAWGVYLDNKLVGVEMTKVEIECRSALLACHPVDRKKVIPVMIVPCKEGKQKGSIRRLASGEGEKT